MKQTLPTITTGTYYYQLIPASDAWLPGKWACCGGVRDYGTREEVANSVKFYLDYFTREDTRSSDFNPPEPMKVVIVRGFHGNVAGRDGAEITEADDISGFIKSALGIA